VRRTALNDVSAYNNVGVGSILRLHHLLLHVRVHPIVVVDEVDKLAPDDTHTFRASGGRSFRALVNHAYALVGFPEHVAQFSATVCRTVVDQYDVQVAVCLTQYAPNAFSQVQFGIVDSYDHAD
jgi:hypothetical protein